MEKRDDQHPILETSKITAMETKKTNRSDLENKRVIFLEMGFIIALAVILLAFEWKTAQRSGSVLSRQDWHVIDEILPVNTSQPLPPPPPPPPKPVYQINEVDNQSADVEEIPLIDVGIDLKWEAPVYIPLPDEPEDRDSDSVFRVVEEMPSFPGGEEALYRFLAEHIKYPRAMVEAGITGTVHLGFVVEKDGRLSSITVGRSPHPMLSDEAVRVLSQMPVWKPGKQRGKPVRVTYGLPIRFSLQ